MLDTVDTSTTTSDLIPENINPNEVFIDVVITEYYSDLHSGMFTDLDFNDYLNSIGKYLSSGQVDCFKCGSPLSVVNNALECQNSHKYTYEQYILEHSDYLKGLIDSLSDGSICS